ncbi:winged helix-turn-helix transcriptional regulator [Candidatus Dojkabacteria bacterium]|uniref:Winged helix-turn-helix transcriptional regulator n=1 Tax=Candidatus Dojkabacteria bacterium TaxID=2099670 RepID=A0A955L4B7_9BACT|nr:winged helix-turn-helix transcriptional regulator [Candidatus Dojkabacteria bacterium]
MSSYNCCTPNEEEFHKVRVLSDLLKLIGEESRLKILCILREGKHCVCEIMEHTAFSQSLISHHLRDLKDAGFVDDDKQGLKVYYALTVEGKALVEKIFNL